MATAGITLVAVGIALALCAMLTRSPLGRTLRGLLSLGLSRLGAGCLLLSSMLYFTVLQQRLVLHELVITLFILLTAPVVTMKNWEPFVFGPALAIASAPRTISIRSMTCAGAKKCSPTTSAGRR